MAHELTFEQIQSCRRVFEMKKKTEDNEEKMLCSRLKEAIDDIDSLHHKMTDEECEDIKVTMKLGNEMDFPTFLRIAAIKFKKQEFVNALEESFRAFDKNNKQYLTFDELKSILTDFGPKISSSEADQLLSEFDVLVNQKQLRYKDFVNENI